MTRLRVPAGIPIAKASDRLVGSRLWMPSPVSPDSVDATVSRHVQATAIAHAIPHTKGSWTEVIAATTKRCTLLRVRLVGITHVSAADSSTLVDIGVGAALSESVIVPDIPFGYARQADGEPTLYEFPVFIPVGSRIAIRSQSVVTVNQVALQFETLDLGFDRLPPRKLVAYGANASTSRGVDLTIPGALNTKGAWTEVVSATDQPLQGIILGAQGGADVQLNAGFNLIDVGLGASGSEQVILPDVQYETTAAETTGIQSANSTGAWIPKGTRLVARFARSVVQNSADVVVIGVPV